MSDCRAVVEWCRGSAGVVKGGYLFEFLGKNSEVKTVGWRTCWASWGDELRCVADWTPGSLEFERVGESLSK